MAQLRPFYPIVSYPQPVLDAFCYDEPFPVDSQAPRRELYPEKPQDPGPLEVKEPADARGEVSFANWAGVVCLFAAFFAFSFTKEKENPVAITFGILFGALALRSWYGAYKTSERYDTAWGNYSRAKSEHDLQIKRYQEALARYTDPLTYAAINRVNYERLTVYAQTESFRQHWARVEKHERSLLSEKGLLLLSTRTTRCARIHAYVQQNAVVPAAPGLSAARGVFDEYFYHLLKKEFPEKVFLDYSVKDADLDLYRYFPDIVYADFGNSLFIDIEIDEAYTANKEGAIIPIHDCYESPDGRLVHADEERNAWFNAHGWTVVRFSEAQVAEDPEGCVEFLRKLISSFQTGLMFGSQAVPWRQGCWTGPQALEVSRAHTRSTYFSARIVAPHKNRRGVVIGSSRYPDGQMKKDDAGKPLGFIRVEQFMTKANSRLAFERRVAFLTGTMEELKDIVAQYNLQHGTVVPGKIVLVESLQPMWKGHQPKTGPGGLPYGFTVRNMFYPVYTRLIYTEDVRSEDVVVTEDEVRLWAGVGLPKVEDDLPF